MAVTSILHYIPLQTKQIDKKTIKSSTNLLIYYISE